MLDFLHTLSGILGSGAIGTALGLIGVWVKGREERETLKLNNDFQLAMRKASQDEMQLEYNLKLKLSAQEAAAEQAKAQTEADAARDVAATNLQASSYDNDKASYFGSGLVGLFKGWFGAFVAAMLALVDVVRGLMRPTITTYLLILTTFLSYGLFKILAVSANLPLDKAWELFDVLVKDIAMLTMTSVTWWFGTRPTTTRG